MKWYTVAASFVTAGLAVSLFFSAGGGEFTRVWWIPGIDASVGIHLTGVGLYVAVVAACVGALAILYSIRYMEPREESYGPTRYYFLTLLFVGAMIAESMADSFLFLYLFWELIGVCSFLLIAYDYRRSRARDAGLKAFVVTRFGDIGLLVAVVTLWTAMNRIGAEDPFSIGGTIQAALAGQIPHHMLGIAGVGFIAAAVGKSALFPLHIWLPDAMEAPTPTNALIHAATLVNAGVYIVARTLPMFTVLPWWLPTLVWIGAISALLTAILALLERDIKHLLAFSTISQLGFMMAAVGAASVFASQFQMLNHGIFKALLFLAAGAVIHTTGTRNLFEMGGLRRSMPLTHITFAVGAAALAVFTLLNGFWFDNAVFEALLVNGHTIPLVMLVLAVILTAIYAFRMYWLTFAGERRSETEAADAPWQMAVPLVVLAVGTVIGWLYVGRLAAHLGTVLVYHDIPPIVPGALLQYTFNTALLALGGVTILALVWLGMRWSRHGSPVPEEPRMWADLVTDTKAFGDWLWGLPVVVMRAFAALISLGQTGDLNYNSLWLALGFIAVLVMLLGWG